MAGRGGRYLGEDGALSAGAENPEPTYFCRVAPDGSQCRVQQCSAENTPTWASSGRHSPGWPPQLIGEQGSWPGEQTGRPGLLQGPPLSPLLQRSRLPWGRAAPLLMGTLWTGVPSKQGTKLGNRSLPEWPVLSPFPEGFRLLTSVTVSCGMVAKLGEEKVKPLSVPASCG